MIAEIGKPKPLKTDTKEDREQRRPFTTEDTVGAEQGKTLPRMKAD